MKVAYVELCGFRGYRTKLRVDFASAFTIVDGRNGVGKSSIFDAVEFALTGTITKYGPAKADGESVADYFWWAGEGAAPEERYVEVGFTIESRQVKIRRTQFDNPDPKEIQSVLENICDLALAPDNPLARLCATAIIRDEHIAGLSLDLKETERYTLLRDGLGASDSDFWVARANRLVALAKQRSQAAQQDVSRLNSELAMATRRVDDVRSALVSDEIIAAAESRVRGLTMSELPVDQLGSAVRVKLVEIQQELERLETERARSAIVEEQRSRLPEFRQSRDAAAAELEQAKASLRELGMVSAAEGISEISRRARELHDLITLGRKVGLRDNHCPLCDSQIDSNSFQLGTERGEKLAESLDRDVAESAIKDSMRAEAADMVEVLQRLFESTDIAYRVANENVRKFDESVARKVDAQVDAPSAEKLSEIRGALQRDLVTLDSLKFSRELERARSDEKAAIERLSTAQARAGRARNAESVAHAFFDASRRAAGETLDRRLDRVLPLMAELYRRLRPHPIWRDIEYSIRGDVRRFLKLQVGEDLNPQFLFSSGQRRATGLAFLLSVNLSLAWSRLSAIMLDDPVQHVDDFRTVHLAELCAKLIENGRQVICSVEDAALADLLCRRLPITEFGVGKRVTLGANARGDLGVIEEVELAPLRQIALSIDADKTG